jgi:tetratricopeptide (TPR) repeat protein
MYQNSRIYIIVTLLVILIILLQVYRIYPIGDYFFSIYFSGQIKNHKAFMYKFKRIHNINRTLKSSYVEKDLDRNYYRYTGLTLANVSGREVSDEDGDFNLSYLWDEIGNLLFENILLGKTERDIYTWGLVYEKLGMVDMAVSSFEEIAAVEPNSAEIQSKLANIYEKFGMLSKAKDRYIQAIKICLDNGAFGAKDEGWYQITEILESTKLELPLNLNPEDYWNIGYAFARRGDEEEALRWYERANEKKAGDINYSYRLGLEYRYTGLWSKAALKFREIAETAPNFADAYYNMGLFYENKGSISEAIQEYEKALRVQPTHIPMLIRLEKMYKKIGMSNKEEEVKSAILNLHKNDFNLDGDILDIGSDEDDRYLQSGWGGREVWGSDTARWALGKVSKVAMYLPQKRSKIIMRLYPLVTYPLPNGDSQEVRVYINDIFIGKVRVPDGWREYEISLPPHNDLQGLAYLTFIYKYALIAKKGDQIIDGSRLFAVAFDYIRFE